MTHLGVEGDEVVVTGGAKACGAATPPQPELPLVSVVVVNYNYGRFLVDAVESIYGQTYPNLECVVVDNASTDDTPAVLAALQDRHPDMVVVRRPQNDGQTPASLDGLSASKGNYVIFLDADDYLLPRCVETHVYTHLSMRPHIGFSSGDMLQVAENRVVVATGEESSRYILCGRGRRPELVRPYSELSGWPDASVAAGLAEKLHYVPPLSVAWVWSPTSGLCYRRDALLMFSDNAALRTLRTGTDLYFAFGCGGLSGGVIIDVPLFAYRIHGGNIFTARAQLDRTLNFAIGSHGDNNIQARLYLIDHFVRLARRFTPNYPLKFNLLVLLFKLDHSDRDSRLPRWARRSRAAQAIARDYTSFRAAVGPILARLMLVIFSWSLRSAATLERELPKRT
jgi:glycosyltransferase involved in cell wall biosynthesis